MVSIGDQYFFGQDALLERLTNGASAAKEVVFVVGAPLTAPENGQGFGVASVGSIVEMIRSKFVSDPRQLAAFERELNLDENKYQAAFRFLQGRRGQDIANSIVRQAVMGALRTSEANQIGESKFSPSDEQLARFEENPDSWCLTSGVRSLGELCANPDAPFGRLVITSNFDPLIGVSIRSAGGLTWRTAIHTDGDFSQSKADGCQVVHIHGFWRGTDTLHTGNQLLQKRPFLQNSLLKYISDKIVVVMAYGGWDDIFTSSLASIVGNSDEFPEILWTFYDSAPVISPNLRNVLQPGLNRNRVTLYSGVDCHEFLPLLSTYWRERRSKGERPRSETVSTATLNRPRFKTSDLECDRPPGFESWVGREAELRVLETSKSKVVAICGIGGQGKSILAAKFLGSVSNQETVFRDWDWRDCREQGDRIRTQLVAAIQRMEDNDGESTSTEIMSDADIIETFISLSAKRATVFVLDNVDNYVDLETYRFVGLLDVLVRIFSESQSDSRIIITCRPNVDYGNHKVVTLRLQGISLSETFELFEQRGSLKATPREDIETAHQMTDGHAFWLDLMAVQVARVPGTTLKSLIEDVKRGRSGSPDILSSIWSTLPEREKTVLRVMAETMRPETEETIQKMTAAQLNYKNFKKAIKSLISLNLIVVKPENNAADLFDLHPLVRQFVRKNFDRPERADFIRTVINQYVIILKGIEGLLGVFLPLPLLERWSQKAELEIEAGLYADAFSTLDMAEDALIGGGHSEEYIRVARKLFQAIDWETAAHSIKLFDDVLAALISSLDQLEMYDDADDMLSRYRKTIPEMTARFIRYCDTKAYSLWQRSDFSGAIEWATRGKELKDRTDVDTAYDCEHTLALAQRDGGEPKEALTYFLKKYDLKDLVDPKSRVGTDQPTVLGNVGRCLQFMGLYEDALVCYRKSARALEDDKSRHRISNQAYARQWIAETFASLGDYDAANNFYLELEELTAKFAPGRRRIAMAAREALPTGNLSELSRAQIKRRVENWIYGRG